MTGGPDRCEAGSPDCGPVEHWDVEGVPLCSRCWDDLTEGSPTKHKAREAGFILIDGGKE